jgi:hypothetical protein
VNGRHEVIRLRRDDCTDGQLAARLIAPGVVEHGEAEEVAVLAGDAILHFRARAALPLEEGAGRNDAALRAQRPLLHRRLSVRRASGVGAGSERELYVSDTVFTTRTDTLQDQRGRRLVVSRTPTNRAITQARVWPERPSPMNTLLANYRQFGQSRLMEVWLRLRAAVRLMKPSGLYVTRM